MRRFWLWPETMTIPIRPTTLLTADGCPEENAADGNVVELLMEEDRVKITGISAKTGQPLLERQYHFLE